MDMPFLRSLQKKIDPSLPHSVGKKTLQTQLREEEHKKLREQLEKVHEYNQKRGLTDRITERHMAQDSYLLSKIVSSKAYQSSEFSDYLFNTLKESACHDDDNTFSEKLKVLQEKMMSCMSAGTSSKYLQAEYKKILTCITSFKDDLKKYYQMNSSLKKQLQKREEAVDKALESVTSVLDGMGLQYLPVRSWSQMFSDFTSNHLLSQSSGKVNSSSIQDTKQEVRLYHPAKLKDYGGSGFINAYINNMLVFLDEEDIKLLEEENNSGNFERYYYPSNNAKEGSDRRKEMRSIEKDLILRLQKGLINMWRARHKNPPEDITSYHRDFIFDVHSLATYLKCYDQTGGFCGYHDLGIYYESHEKDKQDPQEKVPEFKNGILRNLFDTMWLFLFNSDIKRSLKCYESTDAAIDLRYDAQIKHKLENRSYPIRYDWLQRESLAISGKKENWEDNGLKMKQDIGGPGRNDDELTKIGLGFLEKDQYILRNIGTYKSVTPQTTKMVSHVWDIETDQERLDFVDIVAEQVKHGLCMPEIKEDDQDYKGVAVFKPSAIACEKNGELFTILLDENGKVVTEQKNESVKENLNVELKKHLNSFWNYQTSLPYQIIYKRVE